MLAAVTFITHAANAALVTPWSNGQLLIGFRASGGNGSSSSYLINIGNATLYTAAAAPINVNTALSLGNINLDLVALYGSNWFTRADVYWGVFGGLTSANPSVFSSVARPSSGTQSSPWPALNLGDRTGVFGQINAVTQDITGGFNTLNATANSPRAAIQTNQSQLYSYNYQVTGAGSGFKDFGPNSSWDEIEGTFSVSSSKALDLYRYFGNGTVPAQTQFRGIFSIDDQGTISFNVIPEPSTWMLLGFALIALFASQRRRQLRNANHLPMKFNTALLAGVSALAFTGISQAQTTTIRIVASNGDRTATQTAISQLLAPGWRFQGINGNTTSNGTLNTATDANFGAWNGFYSGNHMIIKVSYSGALAGIKAVASNPKIQQRFVATNGNGTGAVPNPIESANPADYELNTADFGFSTNFQGTSPFNGLFQGVQYDPLVQENVGVSPLGFYASPGFPATNITYQQAALLYRTGSQPLSLFTGNWTNGDQNKLVYAIGRNTDAGQRFSAHGEVGLGTVSPPFVWFPTISGATTNGTITYGGNVTSHVPWPVSQTPGELPVAQDGQGGYNSGANLARVLTVVLEPDAYKGKYEDPEAEEGFSFLYPDATAGYYIGYITPGDALNRVLGVNGVVPPANRGVALSYNGVPLHDPTTKALIKENVQSGLYTAWLYNRIIKPTSGLTGLKLTFANALRDRIKNVVAGAITGGIFDDTNFKVKKTADGGLVSPK